MGGQVCAITHRAAHAFRSPHPAPRSALPQYGFVHCRFLHFAEAEDMKGANYNPARTFTVAPGL